MLKVENTETYGWEAAIRGMRNPLNSWDKSDSKFYHDVDCGCPSNCSNCEFFGVECDCSYIGKNDLALMKKLAAAGNDHGKFMRMITVTCDIVAPLYWWKEFDTYKVGTVANSCSTMHKLTDKEFSFDDFSCDGVTMFGRLALGETIKILNQQRNDYLKIGDKRIWRDIIVTLPCSYNQRRTVQINYAVLKNIYNARRAHKLDEWHTLCEWIEHLPYSELITET